MAAPSFSRAHGAILAGLVLAGSLAFVLPIEASNDGVLPPQGCTCHDDNPSTAVQVQVDGWPAVYTPDESYALTVTATGDVPGTQGGLSVEVTKGSLSSADPLVAASGRFATHTAPGERAWPLVWRAPPEDSGGVTLTAYVNLVNGDGSNGPEDHWNVGTFTAVEKAPEPPKPSNLHLEFEWNGTGPIAGTNFTLVAVLSNFTSAPIVNAQVDFWAHLSFGVLAVGSARTDENGSARVNWTVVSGGEFLYLARYAGSSKNLSADANATLDISDPNHVFEGIYGTPATRSSSLFDPVRIPLALIVGGVWCTFAFAGVQVLRVRKQGSPANDGPRDLLRLLVPQFGSVRGKKP